VTEVNMAVGAIADTSTGRLDRRARTRSVVETPSQRVATVQRFIDWVAIIVAAGVPGPLLNRAVFAAVVALTLQAGDAHRPGLRLGFLDVAPSVVRWLGAATALVAPLAIVTENLGSFGRQAAATTVALLVSRIGVGSWARRGRLDGRLLEQTAVVGCGPELERMAHLLAGRPDYGLYPVPTRFPDELRSEADPVTYARSQHPDATVLILTSDLPTTERTISGLRQAVEAGIEVYVQPRFSAVISSGPSAVTRIHDIPLHRLRPHPLDQGGWFVKRLSDVVGAAIVLVATAPVLAMAAVGVRLSSPGPILFRQKRIGKDGIPFEMLKFRTFPIDHEDVRHSLAHDECPLPFGRFLRRTSLDELPQLWNVLRGDMSIVGPRPERVAFANALEAVIPDYADRHRVPGGITGLAQVEGFWGDTSIEDRVRLDNRYIDSWSLWTDIQVVLRTLGAVIRKGR
jgi:exopolysaccharide biosynthesis polyprenyl glycosylphosphotransferase